MENCDLYQQMTAELESRYLVQLREENPEVLALTTVQMERADRLMASEQQALVCEFMDTENQLQAMRMQHLFLAGARECVNILRVLGIIQ